MILQSCKIMMRQAVLFQNSHHKTMRFTVVPTIPSLKTFFMWRVLWMQPQPLRDVEAKQWAHQLKFEPHLKLASAKSSLTSCPLDLSIFECPPNLSLSARATWLGRSTSLCEASHETLPAPPQSKINHPRFLEGNPASWPSNPPGTVYRYFRARTN